MQRKLAGLMALIIAFLATSAMGLADNKWGLKKGTPELKSAGPLAFGPDGILLVGDTKSATIFAIATGDTSGNSASIRLNIRDLKGAVASTLQEKPAAISINDLAANPLTGNLYLSVSRSGQPAIVRINADG